MGRKIEQICRESKRVQVGGKMVLVGQIDKSSKLRRKLVVEDSEKAIEIYHSDRNENLGRLLVNTYKNKGIYDERIAKIAKRFHLNYLKEPLNPVKQAALDSENDMALASIGNTKITDSRFGNRYY